MTDVTQVVDPFQDPIGMEEKSQENMERQLLAAKTKTSSCNKYGEKLEGKLLEAEAFAAVWQRAGKDLRDTLMILQPIMATNPILKQKLTTVLEMTEENLQLGIDAGIALKTVNRCTNQSETIIKQTQTVLDEMLDSLVIYAELGLIPVGHEDKRDETKINPQNAATSHQSSSRMLSEIPDQAGISNQTLLFSGKAREAWTALTSLKAELNEMQNRIGKNPNQK